MELESVSKISKDDYCKFYRFANFKTGWKKFLIPTELALLVILTVMISIGAFYSSDFFLLILVDVFAVFLLLYVWFIAPRVAYKLSAKLYSVDNYFTWYDDHFTVKADAEGMTSSSDIKYLSLLKVCESNDFLYLYVTKNRVQIIPKKSFTKGSWSELSNILEDILGSRYKICYK